MSNSKNKENNNEHTCHLRQSPKDKRANLLANQIQLAQVEGEVG
jgi:hypothetical protein